MTNTTHDVAFQNAGAASLAAGIATFGQVFQRGEIPSGATLVAKDGAVTVPIQMDVKTRYEDGSVKMAVLAVERPALAAGETFDFVLAKGPAAAAPAALDLAKGLVGHSFVVQAGATKIDVVAVLNAALKDGSASFWQKGALATEARVEIDLPGSQRMIFDVTVYKGGGFAVEAQFNNDGAMGATGGRVSYPLTVTMDGKVVTNTTLNQAQYQNWHESYSNGVDGGQGTGRPSAGWLNIVHDIAQLQDAGAVANYNLDLKIDEGMLKGYATSVASSGWDAPLAGNGVTKYMPGTGARDDIGITTEPNTAWLISQDARAAAYALGQAETASSIPWHFWDGANGTWLNTDAYPKLWVDGRGGTGRPGDANSGGLTQQQASDTGWTLDAAHQPNLSYVPYLMTGERWMLDNLQAQAAWNIIGTWPLVRSNGTDLVVNENQVRGAAWALREVDQAALVSPDGSKEKAFFQSASDANYKWLVSKIPEWTAQQGEAHGWVPGVYGYAGVLPPWQQDYFASTVIAAARAGNADAKTFLEWQSNFLVGRFTAEDEGFEMRDGAAYLIAISDKSTGRIYKTWEEIGAKTVSSNLSNGDTSWSKTQGDYGQLALATLSGIYEVTGNPAAKAAYEALMREGVPFTSTATFAKDPTFALAAPGSTPTQQPPVVPPPVVTPPVVPPPVVTPPVVVNPPVEPTSPVTPTPGKMEALAVKLGADSWQGNPIAVVKVDGKEVFRGEIAAAHSKGGQVVQLGKYAADADHVITVQFTNDAWGGSTKTDRNLYVEAVLVDGVATGQSQALLSAGTATFKLAGEAPPVTGPTPVPVKQDVLKIGIAQDAWQGDARYIITLDDKQVGGERVAKASAAKGEIDYVTLTGDFHSGPHKLGVTFLNDAWGGSAKADRNLYVEKLILNDVDLKKAADLLQAGTAKFEFKAAAGATSSVPAPSAEVAAPSKPVSPAPATPAPTTPPSETVKQDVLKIGIAQDAWQGDARYIITLDDKQVGGERVAKASAAKGEIDYVTLTGDFHSGPHKLGVTFLNDAWGGSAKADRNLYVEKLILNDVDLKKSADLLQAGTAKFEFKAVAAASPAAEATAAASPAAASPAAAAPAAAAPPAATGSGPDVLRVALSQDAYKGDATFLLFIDGKQVGGLRSVDASHGAGQKDFIELRGDFDAGDHVLGIRFTNDLWEGSASTDRNLYVDAVELNGVSLNATAALLSSGDVFFQF
jgi:hypothetical protein